MKVIVLLFLPQDMTIETLSSFSISCVNSHPHNWCSGRDQPNHKRQFHSLVLKPIFLSKQLPKHSMFLPIKFVFKYTIVLSGFMGEIIHKAPSFVEYKQYSINILTTFFRKIPDSAKARKPVRQVWICWSSDMPYLVMLL